MGTVEHLKSLVLTHFDSIGKAAHNHNVQCSCTSAKGLHFVFTIGAHAQRGLQYVKKLWQVNKPICKFAQAYLDRVRSLCVPWKHKKSQRRACIDSRMLSTTVARLSTSYRRETAHTNSPSSRLSRMRSSPRVFHFFRCVG